MARPRILRPRRFHLLMAFALIALAIRAAVPAGFMLSAHEGRWIVVTLCSDVGPKQVMLDLETGAQIHQAPPSSGDEDDGARVHQAPCVFAAASSPPPPLARTDLAPTLRMASLAAPAFPASVAVGRGLAAPPPWATGPPARL